MQSQNLSERGYDPDESRPEQSPVPRPEREQERAIFQSAGCSVCGAPSTKDIEELLDRRHRIEKVYVAIRGRANSLGHSQSPFDRARSHGLTEAADRLREALHPEEDNQGVEAE